MADADTRRRRVRAQRMAPRAGGVAEVVRDVLGIQAQDAGAARLGVRARCEGIAAADVDAAGLVRTWAWRGTLHLLARDDVPWVLAVVGPWRETARWRQLGLDETVHARARTAILDALPATRAELREALGPGRRGASASPTSPPASRARACSSCASTTPSPSSTSRRSRPATRRSRSSAAATPPPSAPPRAKDLAKWSGVARAPHVSGDAEPAPPERPPPPRLRLPTCSATPTATTSSHPSTPRACSRAAAGSTPSCSSTASPPAPGGSSAARSPSTPSTSSPTSPPRSPISRAS